MKTPRKPVDIALAATPPHILARLGIESALGKAISKIGHYGFGWSKADDSGCAIKSVMPEMLGANQDRHDDAEARAAKLKSRYPEIWGKRSAAKRIAAESMQVLGISITVRTAQRYMRQFP